MTPTSKSSLATNATGAAANVMGQAAWTTLELTLALGFLWLMAGLPGLGG